MGDTRVEFANGQPEEINDQSTNENHDDSVKEARKNSEILYAVENTPPWYICILLGFQHYITMAGSTLPIIILVTGLMCIGEKDTSRAAIISTTFFVCGFITLLQTTLGIRLPIVQGGSGSYVAAIVIILKNNFEPCPEADWKGPSNATDYEENWKMRMREVSGSIAVASLLQVVLGLTGLAGLLLRWITPLVIAPTVTLVGLALIDVGSEMAAENWGIAFLTLALITIFSQYLDNIPIRWKWRNRAQTEIFLFKLFPVLIAVVTSWSVCGIATRYNLFSGGNKARTDQVFELLNNTPWFRFPYPTQWGIPTVSIPGVVGILVAVLSSVVESIGDYHACAKIVGSPRPTVSAINRGIFIEGIGSVLTGLWGTGNGSTSYSENVGAIAITKVASRRVVQCTAGFMVVFGLLGKIGALFVSIPVPIVGGILFSMFSVITGVGISSLQFVNLGSSRNIFVLGSSLFVGLAIPKWIGANKESIQTGSGTADQIINILLSTSMFVGGVTGFLLDNTMPGTPKDRGLLEWHSMNGEVRIKDQTKDGVGTSCYDLPFGMDYIRRVKWLQRFPLSPTFTGFGVRTNIPVNNVV